MNNFINIEIVLTTFFGCIAVVVFGSALLSAICWVFGCISSVFDKVCDAIEILRR